MALLWQPIFRYKISVKAVFIVIRDLDISKALTGLSKALTGPDEAVSGFDAPQHLC